MEKQELRTYRRRLTTRESGYHVCDDATGGECVILNAQIVELPKGITKLVFYRDELKLLDLFESGSGFIAFGGYLFVKELINISFELEYSNNDGVKMNHTKEYLNPLKINNWSPIGFHKEVSLYLGNSIYEVTLTMNIECFNPIDIELISFDFDVITKKEFFDRSFEIAFNQKTSMHIPYLYYLQTTLSIDKYLTPTSKIVFKNGCVVALKSCNRCGRYLPINIYDETATLSFSLHCKKKAPCTHSTFRNYTIVNIDHVSPEILNTLKVQNNKLISYYGHQLECKACKKFFVNSLLNPQRNPQQFKEDGLRRRAFEILVNHLLNQNIVHFEFKQRTQKEFSTHIWEKFNCRCFKCDRKILLDEMHLDHTMPLSFLYRLDETATCLCSTHNSQKSDHFPVEYYTDPGELERLSKLTGLSIDILKTKEANPMVIKLLSENIIWFFDEFLADSNYQKVRDGIRTADKIFAALSRVIKGKFDLIEEYRIITNKYPETISRNK